MNTEQIVQKITGGDTVALARVITLVESLKADDQAQAQAIVEALLPLTGGSLRIAVSGVPGAGKSTFIETLGSSLVAAGRKVAVLAIDPSSPVGGGSIMGDRIRMEKLSSDPNAFIRAVPTGGFLGGVGRTTRESIVLCEAAGFDTVFLETVGVGQSEYQAASMVDCFVLIALAHAGDEIQGIKKGILELVDVLVVSKADGYLLPQARETAALYRQNLRAHPEKPFWHPPALTCSSLAEDDVAAVWKEIEAFAKASEQKGYFQRNRRLQNGHWMDELVERMIAERGRLLRKSDDYRRLKKEVVDAKSTPTEAAKSIVDALLPKQP